MSKHENTANAFLLKANASICLSTDMLKPYLNGNEHSCYTGIFNFHTLTHIKS